MKEKQCKKQVNIYLNDEKITANVSERVIDLCYEKNVLIPSFCYHKDLSIVGNCRMCLVEIENFPKLIPSCSYTVSDLPKKDDNLPRIITDSHRVKQARHDIMGFILANHPLDCPICDQGGECDLQDQSFLYGSSISSFDQHKRAIENKYIGCRVQTYLTRCIHCTRCTRFLSEISGIDELGFLYRGEEAELSTYLSSSLQSELQGNIIDLCPVGALTSKPYKFRYRPWELTHTKSIDITDGTGSNIRIDSFKGEVVRILPRVNNNINEEWISDRARFFYDGLLENRIDRFYLKRNGSLFEEDPQKTLQNTVDILSDRSVSSVGVFIGPLVSLETMSMVRPFFSSLNCDVTYESRPCASSTLGYRSRDTWLFNSTINGIDVCDLVLLIGSAPRFISPAVNVRIRKNWRKRNIPIGFLGKIEENFDFCYPVHHCGSSITDLNDLLLGSHPFAGTLKKALRPLMIIGEDVFYHEYSPSFFSLLDEIKSVYGVCRDDWNGYNVLLPWASSVSSLDFSLVPDRNVNAFTRQYDVIYSVGREDIKRENAKSIIYHGHHGVDCAHISDVILASSCFCEQDSSFVNIEGNIQKAPRISSLKGAALSDYDIFSYMYQILNKNKILFIPAQHSQELKNLKERSLGSYTNDKISLSDVKEGDIDLIVNRGVSKKEFYLCNSICQSSSTLRQCVKEIEEHVH